MTVGLSVHEQLGIIQTGLKKVRNSPLMQENEFRDMYRAADRHFNDVKLGHLTGKPRDLLEKSYSDTRFYAILIRMMTDAAGCLTDNRQKSDLEHVHTWYLTNRHVLHSAPKFGKARQKSEANKLLKKKATPRLTDAQRLLRLNDLNSVRSESRSGRNTTSPSTNSQLNTKVSTKSNEAGGRNEISSQALLTPAPTTTPQASDDEDDTVPSPVPQVHITIHEKTDSLPIHGSRAASAASLPRQTDVPVSVSKPKMVHPISSLINPHAHYQPSDERSKEVLRNPEDSMDKAAKLRMWKAFQEEHKSGQDILEKLQFCGRNGCPYGQRYVAHEMGESPEYYTNNIVAEYTAKFDQLESTTQKASNDFEKSKLLAQTLEDLYKTAGRMYPADQTKYPGFRPRSSPSTGRANYRSDENTNEPATVSTVNMEDVLSMIDHVTDDMTTYKERLVPSPGPGFNKPTMSVNEATVRAQSAPVRRIDISPHSASPCLTPTDIRPPDETDWKVHFPRESANASPTSAVVQAIDWRGKVEPESTRYKWTETGFGSHTYVKKLSKKSSPRTRAVGSTSAGGRPKTAPTTTQEKWKTEKPSDQNTNVKGAASHHAKEIDPSSVAEMMKVLHVGGQSDDPTPRHYLMKSFGLNAGATLSAELKEMMSRMPPPTMEFLSITAPKPCQDHQKSQSAGPIIRTDVDTPRQLYAPPQTPLPSTTNVLLSDNESEQIDVERPWSVTDPKQPDNSEGDADELEWETFQKQVEASAIATSIPTVVDETRAATTSASKRPLTEPQQPEKNTELKVVNLSLDNKYAFSRDKHNANFHVAAQSPRKGLTSSKPSSALPEKAKSISVTDLSRQLNLSEHWSFSPDVDIATVNADVTKNQPNLHINGEYWLKELRNDKNYCRDCKTSSSPRKDGKTARRPKTSAGRKIIDGKAAERPLMKKRARSAGPTRMLRQREQQPAKFIVGPKPTAPSIPSPHHPFGGRSPRLNQAYQVELEKQARKMDSPRRYLQTVTQFRGYDEDMEADSHQTSSGRTVAGLTNHTAVLNIRGQGMSSQGGGGLRFIPSSQPQPSDPIKLHINWIYSKQANSNAQSSVESSPSRPATATSSKRKSSTNHGQGRPIPDYVEAVDPDHMETAVQRQKEAKAAVDIQRIFRGYVARSHYEIMLRQRRWALEDRKKDEQEGKRLYREHAVRKSKIENRPLDPEAVDWSRNYENHLSNQEKERKLKAESTVKELVSKNQEENKYIATIGPHVDIYQNFHPKKTGPTTKELNLAASIIQRYTRGFLIRRRFEKLNRKVSMYCQSFKAFMKDYNALLCRIQRRHGIERPKTPFSIEEVTEFIDMKKRYESTFDKRSFGGELDEHELPFYFNECDLYPAPAEVDDAIDMVFKGKKRAKQGSFTKKEVIEITFQIYIPKACCLPDVRRSTWMNPIIDGQEALKLLGSESVEPAPLRVCAELVAASMKERKLAEEQRLRDERRQIENS
ncbi:uncharacterized protein LOC141906491 isoform X2 [Tubulanus polymorphus]|uniref:uncharacterized protein LOC141906491 isoform X2 n=1 Tax=Tubulanus polymorphus TaxID=672921 RepID=UPI003DA5B105